MYMRVRVWMCVRMRYVFDMRYARVCIYAYSLHTIVYMYVLVYTCINNNKKRSRGTQRTEDTHLIAM